MSKSKKTKLIHGLAGFKLKEVQPKTDSQADTFDAYHEGFNLLLHGAAGTGKSYISLWLALQDLFEAKFMRIVIIRSVVPSREMGFLPGSIKEKSQPYEAPYKAIVNTLFGRADAYDALVEKGAIEFMTTSFERGITINDAVVIIDEIQNMTFQELDTTITRVGENCRVVLSGDIDQTDLYKKSNDITGLPAFLQIIQKMESFDCIEFRVEDIVRSGLVKEYLVLKQKLGLNKAA